jgi:hypothetical protein
VNEWGYVIAGWALTVVVIAGYAAWVIVRGRSLSRQVPPEDRRWM